jgi:hypothetical protein
VDKREGEAMAGDQWSDRWDKTYDDNKYVVLVVEFGSGDPKLKLKFKNEQEGWIWAKKSGRKYVLNFGLGDEEFDADDLPSPMRKLIDSSGGGPYGNAAQLPPVNWVTRDYMVRPYVEYFTIATSHGKLPLPERLYRRLGKIYLDKMGTPLYL